MTTAHGSLWSRAAAVAIGRRIRAIRRARGLTCAALASRIGTWRPILGRVERGVHLPSLPFLAEISAALGVPLAALVQPVDRMPPPGFPEKSDTASPYRH